MNATSPIDINTATADALDAIPALKGHGFEIVRYRNDRGGFSDLRQLAEVPGMAHVGESLGDAVTIGNG
jgi:competence protein ComEA